MRELAIVNASGIRHGRENPLPFSVLLILLALPAHGSDLSDWFSSLKRVHPPTGLFLSCCAEYDAVYADQWRVDEDGQLVVTVTGRGSLDHWWSPIGREYQIPGDMIIVPERNPTGQSLLFLSPMTLEPICFVFGDGV